jgi:hypothetical protein
MVRYGEFENLNSSRAADYATSTISSAADTISYVSWRVSALLPSPRRRSGDVVESEAVNLLPRSGRFCRRFYSSRCDHASHFAARRTRIHSCGKADNLGPNRLCG